MRAKAYAAGTVLNALATGVGSAFGVELFTEVSVELSDTTVVINNGRIVRSKLVDEILSKLGVKAHVEIRSEIPPSSGLGSSSAVANALIIAVCRAAGLKIDSEDILRLNATASLKAGVSYTGAIDDAAASLLGGFVVTDNYRMEVLRRDEISGYVAMLLPRFRRADVDVGRLRKNSEKMKRAVELAMDGKYCEAMIENTRFYCEMLGYPIEIAEIGWKIGVCCGLSGNGPSFCAFGSKSEVEEVADLWLEYGKVIVRRLAEKPVISP